MKELSRYTLTVSIGMYALSLMQDAFYIDRTDYAAWSSGIGLLLVGWIAIPSGGGAAWTWLANPILYIAWILLFNNVKLATAAGIMASIAAISFLFFDQVVTSEAPTYSRVTHYCFGYWLWVGSCFTTAIGATIAYASHLIGVKTV